MNDLDDLARAASTARPKRRVPKPTQATKDDNAAAIIGLVLVLIVIGGIMAIKSGNGTATPTAVKSTAAAHADAPADDATIPGMMPVDVYGNLTARGFSKKGPEEWNGGARWYLQLGTPTPEFSASGTPSLEWTSVEIFGPNASAVRRVNAISVQRADPDGYGRTILAFIATIPFDGANPAAARQWVEANIGRSAKAKFGGINFELEKTGPMANRLMIYAP